MIPLSLPEPDTAQPDDETLHVLAVALGALFAEQKRDADAYAGAHARFLALWLPVIAQRILRRDGPNDP